MTFLVLQRPVLLGDGEEYPWSGVGQGRKEMVKNTLSPVVDRDTELVRYDAPGNTGTCVAGRW